MDKTAKKKDPLMCYFHFMFNQWNEKRAEEIFADASCGWQYLWQKWSEYIDLYGFYGAIIMYYVEALDKNLQNKLATAANLYYNGK